MSISHHTKNQSRHLVIIIGPLTFKTVEPFFFFHFLFASSITVFRVVNTLTLQLWNSCSFVLQWENQQDDTTITRWPLAAEIKDAVETFGVSSPPTAYWHTNVTSSHREKRSDGKGGKISFLALRKSHISLNFFPHSNSACKKNETWGQKGK